MVTLHDKYSRDITERITHGPAQIREWILTLACGHRIAVGIDPLNAQRWFCPHCFHAHLTSEREANALRQMIDSRN